MITMKKWLDQKAEYIPNKYPFKCVKIPRKRIFAKQGLNQIEIRERYLFDVEWREAFK